MLLVELEDDDELELAELSEPVEDGLLLLLDWAMLPAR